MDRTALLLALRATLMGPVALKILINSSQVTAISAQVMISERYRSVPIYK